MARIEAATLPFSDHGFWLDWWELVEYRCDGGLLYTPALLDQRLEAVLCAVACVSSERAFESFKTYRYFEVMMALTYAVISIPIL